CFHWCCVTPQRRISPEERFLQVPSLRQCSSFRPAVATSACARCECQVRSNQHRPGGNLLSTLTHKGTLTRVPHSGRPPCYSGESSRHRMTHPDWGTRRPFVL